VLGVRPSLIASAAAAVLALAAPAGAAIVPPGGEVITGVTGTESTSGFSREVDATQRAMGFFTMWYGSWEYIFDAVERENATLVLHLTTTKGQHMPEVHTPLALSRGDGDRYLVRLNRRLAEYGKPAYVRLLAEMNQADNAYAAFDHSGRFRGKAHSTAAFRQAWRRSTLILRGGPVAAINEQLSGLNMPPVEGAAADGELPRPQVDMMWVPQTRGTPDIPANMPKAYWPGSGYVDWVGTDFYSRFPRFDWLTQFYDTFRGKPFVFGEWAMWGADNPGFVKQLFSWIHARPRVKMVLYNQGKLTDGPFRLSRFPKSKAELRKQLRDRRFRG
jgi:hypothetical protein